MSLPRLRLIMGPVVGPLRNGTVTPMTITDDTKRFLTGIFEHLPHGHFVLLWQLPGKASTWCGSIAEALVSLVSYDGTTNMYVGVGLSAVNRGPKERVKADETSGLLGLVADVDFCHEAHTKADQLPPTPEEAQAVIDSMGLKPSILVHSGHGLQAWWLFREPWMFDSAQERQQAQQLSRDWGATLKQRVRIEATPWTARLILPGL